MSREYGLEGGYRRLLRAYPAKHRRQHGEEMIGVLMSSARPGQRRPGLADSANLLWGAMRIRLRAELTGTSAPLWRDTLAVVSVIVPFLLLLLSATQLTFRWIEAGLVAPIEVARAIGAGPGQRVVVAGSGLPMHLSPTEAGGALLMWEAIGIAPLLILAVLVLLRLRRTAAVATAAMLVYLPVSMVVNSFSHNYLAPAGLLVLSSLGLLTALALELAALLASAGPRRGLEIMTWQNWTVLALSAVAFGAAEGSAWWLRTMQDLPLRESLLVAVIAVIAIGMARFSPLSRRVMIVLAVPVFYYLINQLVPRLGPLTDTLAYLPLVLLCLVAIAVTRHRRTVSTGGQPT